MKIVGGSKTQDCGNAEGKLKDWRGLKRKRSTGFLFSQGKGLLKRSCYFMKGKAKKSACELNIVMGESNVLIF